MRGIGRIALKMLTGDRTKYVGLIIGVLFSTFLMAQQVSIFVNLLGRTAAQIKDVREADVWVMDPQVQYSEEIKAMPDRDLLRVRGVDGVEWAVPLFKGFGVIRSGGNILQQATVIGVDDATLIGRPPAMIAGTWESLKQPNAMIMDRAGWEYIWGDEPYEIGRVIEINDRRVVITGICDASPPFLTFPIVFTRYSEALRLSPGERNRMSFIVVKAKEGMAPAALATRIQEQTGLQALTGRDFEWRNINHYLSKTGIPINFGITVFLGFLVGVAVAGQTFYLFVVENMRQYGALKAIGVTNTQLMGMVGIQALTIAVIGYSIGIGLTSFFFFMTRDVTALRGFDLPWYVAGGAFVAVIAIILIAAFISIRRATTIDPAIVFRG